MTIFVSGLNDQPESIFIVHQDTNERFTLVRNNADLNQLQVQVPGTTPAGTYNVIVEPDDSDHCNGRLDGGLIIRDPSDTMNIFDIVSVNPSFVRNNTVCVPVSLFFFITDT